MKVSLFISIFFGTVHGLRKGRAVLNTTCFAECVGELQADVKLWAWDGDVLPELSRRYDGESIDIDLWLNCCNDCTEGIRNGLAVWAGQEMTEDGPDEVTNYPELFDFEWIMGDYGGNTTEHTRHEEVEQERSECDYSIGIINYEQSNERSDLRTLKQFANGFSKSILLGVPLSSWGCELTGLLYLKDIGTYLSKPDS